LAEIPYIARNNQMNTQVESWITPDFEEVAACMECTAYSETLE
jgi:hypothetical protein